MIIHKCDRDGCDAQYEQSRGTNAVTPKNWVEINLLYNSTRYEICEDCRVSLKIPEKRFDQKQDIADRLMEILEEMTQEAMENAC